MPFKSNNVFLFHRVHYGFEYEGMIQFLQIMWTSQNFGFWCKQKIIEHWIDKFLTCAGFVNMTMILEHDRSRNTPLIASVICSEWITLKSETKMHCWVSQYVSKHIHFKTNLFILWISLHSLPQARLLPKNKTYFSVYRTWLCGITSKTIAGLIQWTIINTFLAFNVQWKYLTFQ